jgi:glycogen debranching enzyme
VRPLLLSSTVTADNASFTVDLTNPDLFAGDRLVLARDTVHVLRTIVLSPGIRAERLELRNFGLDAVDLELGLEFDSEFADIFEVRGTTRSRRGVFLRERIEHDSVTLGYKGLDGVVRRCTLRFDPPPAALTRWTASHRLRLAPHATEVLCLVISCAASGEPPRAGYEDCRAAGLRRVRGQRERTSACTTSNELFNSWIERSRADLHMLVTETPEGPYPYAGIPWFCTPFGRDGIITALECLWLAPELAQGVLRFLATTQATELDPRSDAEPGKILHETRKGEMAALGEVPFARYYGSVDATPLFVILAAAYHARTGDVALIRQIWPNIEAALGWMDAFGDSDGDGFLEYARKTEIGLVNQGWKDSSDSIFYEDGRLAEEPIALCEVQAYAFAAWRGAAALAGALGRDGTRYAERAEAVRARFEATFWCEELGTYALALDGRKRPCRVRSSNAGHALWAGIAAPERAARVAAALMSGEGFSGWGIRTIAEGEARYNPMSYHNGSVWPHDNGVTAMGFARYGLREPLLKLLEGMFGASQFMDLHRLPELFCGFRRRVDEGPTSYPVACNPQAWSSATVFALIGAALGMSFDPAGESLRFTRPILPEFLDELRLTRLRFGATEIDLLFRRHTRDVALNVLHKTGPGEIILTTG